MDHREEELGDSDSDNPSQRDEVSIDPMQNSLQGLPFPHICAEEKPEKFLNKWLVDHSLQTVGFKMGVFKESKKDGVGQ